ncbi:bifunctional 3-(3-hydroxy-phenyl)propionate/3-hydroxycinnamic acid hydroxylase [Novosphingobium sp.]|uniref:bifunctional 3-(3-hydroxy-phenyl)propionate/3-hydroxycinnamic acid hydroxylase n=1 Tax=Novosphingobium sp. TaxID=1874826 RepID=UPI00260AFA1B|nr:bifunctional 3-(3-hydroxy-phenyl)propionate/3-hydroxycinnamic acid hydroxylase [Novosphingobium sp.]
MSDGSMNDFDCDVLVIGMGPTGDVLAGLAAQHGLSVIAIDREAEPFPLPRAAVFDDEIMRIFQMLGVAERIEPMCRVPDAYTFVNPEGQVLLDFKLGGVSPISGWRQSFLLHQPTVEGILRERLGTLGVDVRLRTALVSLEQDEAGVTARLAEGGIVRAHYAIGCDGGRSPVRDALGVGMFDYEFDEPWLVIDTIVEGDAALPLTCQQIADPKRPATYLAMSPPRYRWEFMMNPGETAESLTSAQKVRDLLAPWGCADRVIIERKAVYRFHGLVAHHWRVGRVLLAGDAAHQMPPFAGQGMCSGVRDAANLAWKLAAVVRGEATAALLDTYQSEREPHVRAIIETAIAMGRVVCLRDPAAAAERDAAMLARKAAGEQDVQMAYPDLSGGALTDSPGAGGLFPQPTLTDGRRLDDVLGQGAWLIGHGTMPEAGLIAVDLDAGDAAPFAPPLAEWLSRRRARAVLVRPDRHVFGTAADSATLATQWRRALGSG